MSIENYGVGIKDFKRPVNEVNLKRAIFYHSEDMINDLDSFFWKPFLRMSHIAKKYGLTTQGAIYVFKRIYGIGIKEVADEKKRVLRNEMRENCQLDSIAKYESMIVRKEGTSIHIGLKGECDVFRKLLSLGFDVTATDKRVVDMKVNGKNVEVKTATTTFNPNSHSKTSYYKFNVTKRQKKNASFFIFYIKGNSERWFIIPSSFVSPSMNYIPSLRSKPKTKNRKANNRFAEFENAWHLLR